MDFFPCCNIIPTNICELWLCSEGLVLFQKGGWRERRRKQWCQFVCPDSDYGRVVVFFLSCRGEKLVGCCLSLGWGISDIHPKSSPADWTFISSSEGFECKKRTLNQTLWINFSAKFGDLEVGEIRNIWTSACKEHGEERERRSLGGTEVVSIHLFIYLRALGPALLLPSLLSSDPRCWLKFTSDLWVLLLPCLVIKPQLNGWLIQTQGSLCSQLWSQLKSEPLGTHSLALI